ncbi:MAG: hypothetical protein ABEI52_12665 [Halobacteriaceae archaeon]
MTRCERKPIHGREEDHLEGPLLLQVLTSGGAERWSVTCPHLEYRKDDDEHEFDDKRAFCTVADRFVQPMRADICNDRYDLEHASDCEIYRDHEGIDR